MYILHSTCTDIEIMCIRGNGEKRISLSSLIFVHSPFSFLHSKLCPFLCESQLDLLLALSLTFSLSLSHLVYCRLYIRKCICIFVFSIPFSIRNKCTDAEPLTVYHQPAALTSVLYCNVLQRQELKNPESRKRRDGT